MQNPVEPHLNKIKEDWLDESGEYLKKNVAQEVVGAISSQLPLMRLISVESCPDGLTNGVKAGAEVQIPYDVFEDNIEGRNIYDTLKSMIGQRIATDLEEILIKGDKQSEDPFLALLDGLKVKSKQLKGENTSDKVKICTFPELIDNYKEKVQVPIDEAEYYLNNHAVTSAFFLEQGETFYMNREDFDQIAIYLDEKIGCEIDFKSNELVITLFMVFDIKLPDQILYYSKEN